MSACVIILCGKRRMFDIPLFFLEYSLHMHRTVSIIVSIRSAITAGRGAYC